MSLLDFGTGLLSGLHLKGLKLISERDLVRFHGCFAEAFSVVKELMGEDQLKFSIILDEVHRVSGDVDAILNYWLTLQVSKDSPGTVWRFHITDHDAKRWLSQLPGGEEVFLPAAEAFLKRYVEH